MSGYGELSDEDIDRALFEAGQAQYVPPDAEQDMSDFMDEVEREEALAAGAVAIAGSVSDDGMTAQQVDNSLNSPEARRKWELGLTEERYFKFLDHVYENRYDRDATLRYLKGASIYWDEETDSPAIQPDVRRRDTLSLNYLGTQGDLAVPKELRIRELEIVGNEIVSISSLPDSLRVLRVFGNSRLESINYFPQGLEYISVQDSRIESLPALPASLAELYVTNNFLKTLPVIPAGVEELRAENNFLTDVPELLGHVPVVKLHKNPLTKDAKKALLDAGYSRRVYRLL